MPRRFYYAVAVLKLTPQNFVSKSIDSRGVKCYICSIKKDERQFRYYEGSKTKCVCMVIAGFPKRSRVLKDKLEISKPHTPMPS